MNKTLILASAALLALTATSCNKQEAPLPTPSAQAGQVTVSFTSEQNTDLPTRAFFDSSSTTEA